MIAARGTAAKGSQAWIPFTTSWITLRILVWTTLRMGSSNVWKRCGTNIALIHQPLHPHLLHPNLLHPQTLHPRLLHLHLTVPIAHAVATVVGINAAITVVTKTSSCSIDQTLLTKCGNRIKLIYTYLLDVTNYISLPWQHLKRLPAGLTQLLLQLIFLLLILSKDRCVHTVGTYLQVAPLQSLLLLETWE